MAVVATLVALMVLVSWHVVSLYRTLAAEAHEGVTPALLQKVGQATPLVRVSHVERFHGRQAFLALYGTDRNGNAWVAWVRRDGEGPVHAERMAAGVSREHIRAQVLAQDPKARVGRIVSGIEEGRPVWEAAYVDAAGRQHYAHFDFYTGALLKTYRLLKTAS